MATMTSTTTAIELEAPASILTQREGHSRTSVYSSDPQSDDPVLEASRLADSSVPDGGHGWVVISVCAVLCWWAVGTSYSWGVIQAALVEKGLSNAATLSFVGSLSPALISALGIVNARIINALGTRWTALIGVSFLGMAGILSSFAVDSVPGLFVTGGVVLGLGTSLCFMAFSVLPAQYFSRKRGLANGIVFAGGGFGGAITSLGLDSLMQRVGLAWTYRVLGLATLCTGLPAAWFMRERTPIRNRAFVDWGLFRSLSFILVFFAGAIATFPLIVPPFFIPLYARAIGLTSSAGAGLLAGFNFSSAVGRIVCGLLCDRLGPLNTLFASLMLSAVSMLALWPASTTAGPLAVFVVVNGLGNGGFFSTMPTVVGNVFGSARVATVMGMVVTGWGGGYLMGAPIAGYLLDAYGGSENGLQAYRPAMFYAGSLALGAAILTGAMRLRMSRSLVAKL